MADGKDKIREEMRKAHADYERAQAGVEKAREARRKSFDRGRSAGLSMRDIGSAVGLHFTRVAQILRDK